jgi:hypothetical protein
MAPSARLQLPSQSAVAVRTPRHGRGAVRLVAARPAARTRAARPAARTRAARGAAQNSAEEDGEDYFDVLQVTPADSADVVRDAYRRLQKRAHPDIAGSSAAAVARSAALNVAFETLNDPARRAAYVSDGGVRRGGGAKGKTARARTRTAPARREGLMGPLRQERLLATLLPRRAAGTARLVRSLLHSACACIANLDTHADL